MTMTFQNFNMFCLLELLFRLIVSSWDTFIYCIEVFGHFFLNLLVTGNMSTFFCTYSVDVWFGLPLCSRGAVDCTTKRLSNPTFCSQDSIRHCKAKKKGNLFWEKFNNSRHARATTHCHVLASSSRPPNGKFLTSRQFKICEPDNTNNCLPRAVLL